MDEIRSGAVSVEDKEPTVIKESIGTALVDGHNLIGKFLICLSFILVTIILLNELFV